MQNQIIGVPVFKGVLQASNLGMGKKGDYLLDFSVRFHGVQEWSPQSLQPDGGQRLTISETVNRPFRAINSSTCGIECFFKGEPAHSGGEGKQSLRAKRGARLKSSLLRERKRFEY